MRTPRLSSVEVEKDFVIKKAIFIDAKQVLFIIDNIEKNDSSMRRLKTEL